MDSAPGFCRLVSFQIISACMYHSDNKLIIRRSQNSDQVLDDQIT